ncbi:MAG: MFS transporter [Candidatus Nanoarchaeia archaeon]|jgi:MFS family permease
MDFKKELSIMWKFYLISILDGLQNITGSVIIIYLFTIGLSTTTIGIFMALLSITSILFEIPTGVVADVFGRKLSTIISYFLILSGIIIYFLTTNFVWILIAFIITGFGTTFRSGAEESWRLDYFLHYGNKKYLNRIISRNKSLFTISLMSSNFLASIILILLQPIYGFVSVVKLMFFIKIILMIIMTLLAFAIKEPYFKKKMIKNYFKESIGEARIILKKSIKEIKGNKKLFYAFIASALFILGSFAAQEGGPIHFNNNGINESLFGIIYGISCIFSYIALALNERITNKLGLKKTIIISSIIISFNYLLFGFNLGWWLVPIFFLQFFFWELLINNLSIRMNEIISTKLRATVLSLKGITDNIPTMLSQIFIFGLMGDYFGISTALIFSSFFIFVSILFFKKV